MTEQEPEPVDPRTLAAAVDQAQCLLIAFEGPDLRTVALNAAVRAILQGRPARLGEPFRTTFPDLAGQRWFEAYEHVYRTGETMTGEEWRVHLTNPDGSVTEMYGNVTISPWRWSDGRLRGVVGVGTDVSDMVRARINAEQDADHLRERYRQSRDVIATLQHELLPRGVPVLPGVQVAASYLLANTDTAAGGDWFDAIARPDGTVALAVGDVIGHGALASAVMGQLRAMLQDHLHAGASVSEALAALDRNTERLPAARAATACLAILDPGQGTFVYCTAGHPPPLLLSTGGAARYLPSTGAGPLGTGGSFPVRRDRVDVGEILLLYSDGILERPGRAVPASTVELAQVAADAAAGRAMRDSHLSPAERVCTEPVELLVRATGHRDDITMLAAQRIEPPPPLEVHATSLSVGRRALGGWLERISAGPEDVLVLQHAVGELTGNAVEYGGGEFTLRAVLDAEGRVHATVTDSGPWRPPDRRPERGLGLALAAQLADRLRVEPGESGTTASVTHRLVRSARMLGTASAQPPRERADEPGLLLVLQQPGEPVRIRVDGLVDATTAPHLQHELLHNGRGGTVPLIVDLTGVTHLASAGVDVLHRVAAQHRRQHTELTLHAEAGSVAQHVLSLVALPHTD